LTLQEHFDSTLLAMTQPADVLFYIFRQKLSELTIELSAAQSEHLRNQLARSPINTIDFDIDDAHLAASGWKSKAEFREQLERSLSSLASDVDTYSERLIKLVPEVVEELTEAFSAKAYRRISETQRNVLADHRKTRLAFDRNVQRLWGSAFDAFETLIAVSIESGALWQEQARSRLAGAQPNVQSSLLRLHARACQVSGEILALLRARLCRRRAC
jgi:hypothetical protein